MYKCKSIVSNKFNMRAFNMHTAPTINRVALLKAKDGTIIRDRAAQMERWLEHYKDRVPNRKYSIPRTVLSQHPNPERNG